jgi:hypothetical protein
MRRVTVSGRRSAGDYATRRLSSGESQIDPSPIGTVGWCEQADAGFGRGDDEPAVRSSEQRHGLADAEIRHRVDGDRAPTEPALDLRWSRGEPVGDQQLEPLLEVTATPGLGPAEARVCLERRRWRGQCG